MLETEEKNATDTPAADDNAPKADAHAHAPTSDSNPSASTKSLPHPPSSFKNLPTPPASESSKQPSRRPSFRRSSTKADTDGEPTRKGSSKESKRRKLHSTPQELDEQYAKQMAKVAKLMRKMARAEQREKNARWKAAMQDITLAREAGIDPQKDKVGWDDDSDDEAAPAPSDNALKKPVTDLSVKPTDADAPQESGDTLARFIHAMFSSINPLEEAHVEPKVDDTEAAVDASKSADVQGESSSKDPKDPQADAEVLRLLSSASTMNQSSQSRRSVWNVLDRLTPGRAKKSGEAEEGSVMLSAPLFVTENSKVTVAQSEMKTIEEHESDTEDAKPNSSKFANLVTRMGMDGMFGKKKKEKEEAEEAPEPEVPVEVKVEPEPPKTKEVRVWRPSADGISLQCSWWGYRIYLPPAVIAVLNDQKLEAANRAAIVTTALQWIIDHVPTGALPPQVGLVMSLIRGIIPAMGYIGGFVAWSWNTIIGFDQGDGVVLSATWLLPIALIPSAWDIEPVGNPLKAVEAAPEPQPEPTPEPIPESKPEPKSESKSKPKSKPQPEPEIEVKTTRPSLSRSASMAKMMPPLERKASVKSSSTSTKEKKAERAVLERSTTSPVPIPKRPPHPPKMPSLAGPLPTPPSSVPRSSSSSKTRSYSHSQSQSQSHSQSQSQSQSQSHSNSHSHSHSRSQSSTPPVTKIKEPKPEGERPTLKKSTSKLGLNIVWSDKPVSEEPKEDVETESMKIKSFKLPMPDITWEHERKAAEAKLAEEQAARAANKAKLKNAYALALQEEMAKAKDKPATPVGWSLLS
ncbi:hypothetical protein OPQ81_003010 [Rhizoctonia solani]|nr:hypothetical protein OPQ81_003010 [Rhizoctonia solani]